ncbi:MAG: hypothetical protein WAN28_15820 [Terracidiphilus sp.]
MTANKRPVSVLVVAGLYVAVGVLGFGHTSANCLPATATPR